MDRGVKKRTSIISTRTDFGDENIDVSVCEESLESLLEEDGTFVEFFNAFLALPMFPIRLYYNADVAYFEEFKHQLADNVMDNDAKKATALQRFSFFKSTIDNKGLKIGYYVKFLSKSDGFNWVKKNRLPLFIKSELCAEYKLARLLSFAQTVYLVNILIDSRNLEKNAFDERSSPQYRTHRTRGKLPGLAEFQERMQLLQEDNESQNCEASIGSCSESNDSDLEEVEFSQMYSRRRNKSSAFEILQSSDDNRSNEDKSDLIQAINETEPNVGRDVSIVIKTSLDGETCTDDPTRSDSFAKENKTVELVKEDVQNTKWDVRKPEEDTKDGQVSTDAGNVFSLQDSGILSVAVALKRTYEEATGLTLQNEEPSNCDNELGSENNQLDNEKTNGSEFQLEYRADENEVVNVEREVTVVAQAALLEEHMVHSDHASQPSTESQQEITQLTNEVKSVVNTCSCEDNSQSAPTSQSQGTAEADILSLKDDTIVEESFSKKIEDVDEIRPDLGSSDSAEKLEKHLGSTKEAEKSKYDDELQGREDVCPTSNDLNCDEENEKINLNPIIEDLIGDDDDNDDLGERMKVTVTTSNTDSGLADDLEFMSIDDPERLSLGINGVTEEEPQSVNAPFISIEGPMGENLRCSSAFSDYSRDENAAHNQEKESFANNDPNDIYPRVQDNIDNLQRIESDKSYLVSNKPNRRGSDLSTMAKNSKNDESLEHQSPRRQSLPLLTREDLRRRLSSVSNASDALDAMNDLLANDMIDIRKRRNQAAISVLYEESDSDEDSGGDNSSILTKKPIDVASKSGMDAFKYFLVDTPGEKLMLLWVEIERLKYCSDKEKLRIVQEIRQRFFRSGAPFELSVGTLKKWKIKNVSEVGFKKLIEVQDKVLEPLRLYWCARFTVHQKRKHKSSTDDYISQDHSCTKSRCSTHQREMTRVPQRPNTCFPHFRVESANRTKENTCVTSSKSKASRSLGTYSTHSEITQPHLTSEGGRTKARIRSKSAYPRLINTSNPKDINLSQKQLQMITTLEEGCGYSSIPNHSYRNDASSPDHKSNIRLYIQPVPPSNCKASTLVRSENVRAREPEDADKIIMDSLVECLLHEKHSGNFFSCYLEKNDNQLWLSCYNFWQFLQDYTEHFFTDKFSPALIKQKAGFIYSNFIVTGSKQCINCSPELQKEVYKRLDPAYEELFDKVEEHALKILHQAFKQILGEEAKEYGELVKSEKLKYLDVRTKLRKPKHQPEEKEEEEQDTEKEDNREKISIEEVNSPLPVSTDGVTFDAFIRNKVEVESFKAFLESTNIKGLKDLLAWTEMENFRRSSHRHNQRNTVAKSVAANWLTNEYFFGPISPATKEAQEKVRSICREPEMPERPPSPVVLEAQKYVRARIERRWFVLFKETSSFMQRHKTQNVTEMVEDMIMKRRLQRSEAAWKILNSRWVSGSRDVVALRTVLMDPHSCLQFRKFLSLKGELMDRNVYFWLEVQKYKDLCHRHVEDSLIKSKIQAIIDVFIKSSVPPELQIDVPIEIAERLHEKACGRAPQHGPYLFREAQTTVFRIMFNHWKEFIAFRASFEEEKLGQHLEELDKKHKAQSRAKKMIAERKRLARAAFDKRRKEREEQEREKERQKNLARAESIRRS